MELYICDFMKNRDCKNKSCAFFGGECACTTKEEYQMDEKDIKELPPGDFMKMHRALPIQLKEVFLAKDWYWVKFVDSLKET